MFRDPTLVGCWAELQARLDSTDTVSRWAAAQPSLAGLSNVSELLEAWADPPRTNRVLLGLVHLAAADLDRDDDALLILLHLLSRLVYRLARELRDLSPDITVIVLGELTCQIRAYRWRTRMGSVVANLRRDTKRAILADLRPSDRYHPERVEQLTWDGTAPEPSAEHTEDIDVVDLLLWAVAAGVSPQDVALLIALECARDRQIPQADRAVAAAHQITDRTLYRRRERALSALRAMTPDYLAATA